MSIKFPISYKERTTYAMGEQEIYYTIHDKNGERIFTAEMCREKVIKQFVDECNQLYSNTRK
jgi:hypothetical protein